MKQYCVLAFLFVLLLAATAEAQLGGVCKAPPLPTQADADFAMTKANCDWDVTNAARTSLSDSINAEAAKKVAYGNKYLDAVAVMNAADLASFNASRFAASAAIINAAGSYDTSTSLINSSLLDSVNALASYVQGDWASVVLNANICDTKVSGASEANDAGFSSVSTAAAQNVITKSLLDKYNIVP